MLNTRGIVVLAQNNDNSNYVEQLIPSFFHTEEPIRQMNGFEVGCFSRYGGLVIRQPRMFAMPSLNCSTLSLLDCTVNS